MTASEYLRIGFVTGSHGLGGRMKVVVVTDLPDRFAEGSHVFLLEHENHVEYTIKEFIPVSGREALLQLEGISDRDSSDSKKGCEIQIDKRLAEETKSLLSEDEFYYYDIIGCSVIYKGELFGTIKEIIEAGSGSVLVILDRNNKEHMIPFVNEMVDTSSLREKRIVINPVEGLIEI